MKKDFSVLQVKDFSVSTENFSLIKNEELDLLYTDPQPDVNKLWKYYESDDYISHTSNKRTVFEKLYHIVREFAIRSKIDLINSSQNKGTLLDIGTGTGDFLLSAKEDGWQVIGVEPNTDARQLAIAKNLNVQVNSYDVPDNSVDLVSMWHVLEHVPNYDLQIKELSRILKPSGTIIIAVPNYKSFDAQYYKQFWAAYDVPRHFWHFSQKSISNIFSAHNFEVKKVRPMIFDSFYVSMLSEKYKSGKINYFKAFWIGLKSNLKARKTSEFSSLIYSIERKKL